MRTRAFIWGSFFTASGLGLFVAGAFGWVMPDNAVTMILGSMVILLGAMEFERGGL